MNRIGQLNCSTNTRNTGFGSCFEDWKQIVGAFIFDGPRTFSKAEVAVLLQTMQSAAKADIKSARMYPVHGFVAPTDSSEKVILETFDYGSKAIVRDGDIDWIFQFVDGGNCLNKALRTHNGKRWVMFYDKENKLMGYNKDGGISAIPLHFMYAHPWALATGSKTAAYMLEFSFLPKYVNEDGTFVKANFDLEGIVGLKDMEMIVNSFNQNTGVANVTLQVACGAENVFDTYKDQFVAGLITARDEEGNAVAVSSIAPVTGSKTFDITLDPGDLPNDGIVTIEAVPVSDLAAGGIVGYELVAAEVEVIGS